MRPFGTLVIVVIAMLIASETCQAKREPVRTEKVSIEKTLLSLQKQLEEHPEDESLLYRLAQVHATAYAGKENVIEVVQGTNDPWYGYRYTGIPYSVVETDDKQAQARAKEHLQKALEFHEKLVKIAPKHFHARLGLAWCMEQIGNIEEAKTIYRNLIKVALPEDRKKKIAEEGTITVSTAASQQLIMILQAEIIALRKKEVAEAESVASRKLIESLQAEFDALRTQSEVTEENITRIVI